MLLIASFLSLLITQKDSLNNRTSLLNEVQITANRNKEIQFNSPYSIDIISNKQLKNSTLRTSPESISGISGLFLKKTNHGGGSAIIRGLMGNQTLILLDGIRLNNSTFRYGPNQYLNTIEPFSIDRIELLKGNGSVQYGTDAMGGTIHVITEEPEYATGLKASLLSRWASHGMEKTVRPKIQFGAKNISFDGSFNIRKFGDLLAGKSIGIQKPTGYDEKALNLKTKLKFNQSEIVLAHQTFVADHVPLYHKVVLENFKINEFGEQKRKLSYFKFNQNTSSKYFENISIIASLQNTYESRISQKNNSNTKTFELDQVKTIGLTTNFQSTIVSNWKANSGIELYNDLVKSEKQSQNVTSEVITKLARALYPNNSKYLNLSAYSLHDISYQKWQISTGLRYNFFKITIPDATIGQSVLKPIALVGNLAILRSLTKKSNIYLSYNSAFRAPNIDDLGSLGLVDFRYELPNYNLKPETSKNLELGFKYRNENFALASAFFSNKLKNLIGRVKQNGQFVNGNQVYTKENIETAEIKGMEISVEKIWASKLKSSAGFAYLYGQNLTKNEPLRRIPPTNGYLDFTYENKSFFLRPNLQWASAQKRLAQGDIDDNRIGKLGTTAWAVFNLNAGYKYKFLKINTLWQNISNKTYKTHGSGVYGVGRSVTISLMVEV